MRNPIKIPTLFLALAAIFSAGCAVAAPDAEQAAKPKTTETAPSALPVPTITKGTIIETMDSGGYTYLCIENEGQKRWAAMPKSDVKVGQEVELAPGIEMGQYTSKTLNRTFEPIYFCNGLVSAPGSLPHPIPERSGGVKPATTDMPSGHVMPSSGMPPGHIMPSSGMPPGHGSPAAGKSVENSPPASTIAGKVAETFDAGGYTYVAVEKEGQTTWVAAPPIKVAVGQEIAFKSGFVMKKFTSKSLERTFDAIVFSSGLATAPPAPAEATSGK